MGSRVLQSQVKPKEQANADYQHAVDNEQSAGILGHSSSDSDVFINRLGNISAGDSVTVNITFAGELKPGCPDWWNSVHASECYSALVNRSSDSKDIWELAYAKAQNWTQQKLGGMGALRAVFDGHKDDIMEFVKLMFGPLY